MATGPILALDLGVRTGFAFGDPGDACPRSGTVLLKGAAALRAVAFGNLIAWLNEEFTCAKPRLVVKEAMLPLQGFKNLDNAAYTVTLTAGLHGIVEGMCHRHGVSFEDVADSTVRRHFIGHGRMGDRKLTKAAVLQRCHLLKYVDRNCTDVDRADAIAIWDWATAQFGNARRNKLYLFGEVA